MGKIAFVFSGQGAQTPGMGQALAAQSEAAARVYAMADAIRPGTQRQCAEAGKEELNQTLNTQPCLFCVDLAAAEALRARGVQPDAVAGFSLGEIPALAFAGMIDAEAAFRLVCVRAEAMQACAEETDGGMVAAMGLNNEAVEALCRELGGVYPVNYNCPGQLVIAGAREKLPGLLDALKRAGGKGITLPVSGAFHSPYMEAARDALRVHLDSVILRTPSMPVYANVTGEPYAAPYADLIAAQVVSPVRWQQTIQRMADNGVDTFIEVGIGKTLCGLIRKTLPEATVLRVEDPESLEQTIRVLNGEDAC